MSENPVDQQIADLLDEKRLFEWVEPGGQTVLAIYDTGVLYDPKGILKPLDKTLFHNTVRPGVNAFAGLAHKLMKENEKLRSDIDCMVKKAADNELEGYRELGRAAVKAERRADRLKREYTTLQGFHMDTIGKLNVSTARCHRLEEALRIMLMEPWDRTVGQAGEARAILDEAPAVSLATVQADAIDKAVDAVDFVKYESGVWAIKVDDLLRYCSSIRQSASESGGGNG